MTAVKVADAINKYYPGTSLANDGGVVNVRLPGEFLWSNNKIFLLLLGQLMLSQMFQQELSLTKGQVR